MSPTYWIYLHNESPTYWIYLHLIFDSVTVKYIMLASMNNELQRQYENIDIFFILLNLKELYGEQNRIARYEISK